MPPIRPNLLKARREAGLTQAALAGMTGIARPVIAAYESGAREPGVRAAIRVAQACGSTVEAIWATEPAT